MIRVFALAVAGSLLGLVAALHGSVQDDSASWVRSLSERFPTIGEFFTPEQLGQLGQMAQRKVAAVPDPAFRQKLLRDIQDRVADHYMIGGFVHAMPEDKGEPALSQTFARTPSSWELFQYDLERRIDRGIATPKRAEDLPLVQQQVDQLVQAAKTRLYNIFTGPGATEFVEASVERWGKIFRGAAESDLEFGFPAPLTPEQFKQVEHALASFVPDNSLEPSSLRSRGAPAPVTVPVADAKTPPAGAFRIVDFQMFLKAQGLIEAYSAPKDFYDDRYRELSRKSSEEIAALCRGIDQRELERFQKRKEELDREFRAANRQDGKGSAGQPGKGSATPSEAPASAQSVDSGDAPGTGRGAARQRFGAAILVLLALGIGVFAWCWRRR